MMGARTTLVLLAVFGTLLGYLLSTGGLGLQPSPAPDGPAPLLAVSPEPGRVELSGHNGRIVAVRGRTGWEIAPDAPRAPDAVGTLLEALVTLRPLLIVDPSPGSPGDYGLGPDADRLRITDGAGRGLLELEIGSRNPSWTGVYVRRQGSPEVLLVGGLLQWELAKLKQSTP